MSLHYDRFLGDRTRTFQVNRRGITQSSTLSQRYLHLDLIVIINSKFLQHPQKRSFGNHLNHRRVRLKFYAVITKVKWCNKFRSREYSTRIGNELLDWSVSDRSLGDPSGIAETD